MVCQSPTVPVGPSFAIQAVEVGAEYHQFQCHHQCLWRALAGASIWDGRGWRGPEYPRWLLGFATSVFGVYLHFQSFSSIFGYLHVESLVLHSLICVYGKAIFKTSNLHCWCTNLSFSSLNPILVAGEKSPCFNASIHVCFPRCLDSHVSNIHMLTMLGWVKSIEIRWSFVVFHQAWWNQVALNLFQKIFEERLQPDVISAMADPWPLWRR